MQHDEQQSQEKEQENNIQCEENTEEVELTESDLLKLQPSALPTRWDPILLGDLINSGKPRYEGKFHVVTQHLSDTSPGKVFGGDGSVLCRLIAWELEMKSQLRAKPFGSFEVTKGVIELPKPNYNFGWELKLNSKSTFSLVDSPGPKPVFPYSVLKTYQGPLEDLCIGGFIGRITAFSIDHAPMRFTVEDISGEKVEVELDNKNTCQLLKIIGDPTDKLLLLRNFSLEKRTSSSPSYALVCYDGTEEGMITTAQILSPQGKLGKPLWDQAKLHHDHCCVRSTGESKIVAPVNATGRTSSSHDLAPILAELKGAITQQEVMLTEVQSSCGALALRLNKLESGRKRKRNSEK